MLRTLRALAIAVVAGTLASPAVTHAAAGEPSAHALYARGVALLHRGEALQSRTLLEQAANAARTAGDRALLQEALGALSDAHADLSDWAAMLDAAQRAYDAAPDPDGRAMVSLLRRRGRVWQELRDREGALGAFRQGLALAERLEDRKLTADVLREFGLAVWRVDRDRTAALRHYDRAIALYRLVGDEVGLLTTLNLSGNLFRMPGLYDEAERRYAEGLSLAARIGARDAFLLKNQGIVMRETGRPAAAARLLRQAIAVADATGTVRAQWQARAELGALLAGADPAEAARQYAAAIDVLEARHSSVLLEGFRAGGLSGDLTIERDPYDRYIELLLRSGREEDAFLVAERARARAFLDGISLVRDQLAAAVPPALAAEERAILSRISAQHTVLRGQRLDAAARAAAMSAVEADEQRLTALRARLAGEHPVVAYARYPRLLDLAAARRELLTPDETLLQYFLGVLGGAVWVVRRDGFTVHRLPPRAEIEAGVRGLLAELSSPEGSYAARSDALRRALLPPLPPKTSRLIVVPHGVLHYLPFEALVREDGRFLIEDHPVAYAPSVSSLAFLRTRRAGGTEVLGVGNPLMRGESGTERAGHLEQLAYLKPLASSGPEVRALGRVFSAVRVLEGGSATEDALSRDDLKRYAIVHFATHGLIDEERPERSAVALSADPPASDGILQMREIYGLRLSAGLVTLSACQTALGRVATGEGMIGLSRAFFYAGAGAVLATVWNVNDRSTLQLMEPFYEAIAAGEPLDAALRAAKMRMIRGGERLAHPYYWAPFVLSGHASAALPARARRTAWPIVLAALGGLALGGLAWRRVR